MNGFAGACLRRIREIRDRSENRMRFSERSSIFPSQGGIGKSIKIEGDAQSLEKIALWAPDPGSTLLSFGE